jgi:hypothetical protein
VSGGETEIRTLGGDKPSTVFKTAAFDRSAISPRAAYNIETVLKINFFYSSQSYSLKFDSFDIMDGILDFTAKMSKIGKCLKITEFKFKLHARF